MSEAYFYHLTVQPLEQTLPKLLGLARKAGWRIAVRGVAQDRLEWLDGKLWEGDGFLPHGIAGGPHDEDQSVLLTTGSAGNAPDCLISVDGAEIAPEEIAPLKRVMIIFDGNDGDALSVARGQWKSLTEAEIPAKYWSQESGSWEMKAQHPKA
ncbi:MAG: DNA polymerase III subunit chi [Pseudomonadota bacterium]